MNDLRFSLKTIGKRSDGLLHFVEDYRKVTKVPAPVIENISVSSLLEEMAHLHAAELKTEGIKLDLEIDEFNLNIDPAQIEQVLINLLSNSRYALEGGKDALIKVRAYKNDLGKHISVSDNGIGIDPKAMEEIFVPFFTTRDNGSGIGLSLSKQIMSLHGARIKVMSKENEGTTVVLSFLNN
jgi:signal transduction histidine kinase